MSKPVRYPLCIWPSAAEIKDLKTLFFVSRLGLTHTRIQDVWPSDDRVGTVGEDGDVSESSFIEGN